MIDWICQTTVSYPTAGSSESGASLAEDMVRVPPRCSVAEAPTASQSPPSPLASEAAAPPDGIELSPSFVSGSITRTTSSNSCATHSEPPAAASAFGPSSTGMVASSRPVEGSSRGTVRSSWFATQIDPNAAMIAVGPFPTCCVSTTFGPVGSTRATLFGATETHTASGVNVTLEGRPASGTVGDLLGVGIHAEERATDRVDDPQHAVAERDPRRCGAGTDRLADLVGLDVRSG